MSKHTHKEHVVVSAVIHGEYVGGSTMVVLCKCGAMWSRGRGWKRRPSIKRMREQPWPEGAGLKVIWYYQA